MSTIVDSPVSTDLLDSLVKPSTLADRLGLSERTLADWRLDGRGPRFVRISRRAVVYRPEDIDAWLESQVRSSTAEESH